MISKNPKRAHIALIISIYIFIFISNASAVAVISTVQLTHGTDTSNRNPAWSPDGSRIAYSAGSGYNYSIWVMDADGVNPVRLTGAGGSASFMDSEPGWSPDGSKLVFHRRVYRSGQFEGDYIYIMDSNGSNQKKLAESGLDPVVSPDGKYIAFAAAAAPDQGYGIFTMSIDGTDVKALTANPGNEIMPSWSPDGKKLAFTGNGIIQVMNADGSNMVSTGQEGYHAKWSKDGKYILFTSEPVGDTYTEARQEYTYIMDTDGANVNRLTFGDNRRDGLLDLSPDGTRVALESAAMPAVRNIYLVKLDFKAGSPAAVQTAVPKMAGFSLLAAFLSLAALIFVKRMRMH